MFVLSAPRLRSPSCFGSVTGTRRGPVEPVIVLGPLTGSGWWKDIPLSPSLHVDNRHRVAPDADEFHWVPGPEAGLVDF